MNRVLNKTWYLNDERRNVFPFLALGLLFDELLVSLAALQQIDGEHRTTGIPGLQAAPCTAFSASSQGQARANQNTCSPFAAALPFTRHHKIEAI